MRMEVMFKARIQQFFARVMIRGQKPLPFPRNPLCYTGKKEDPQSHRASRQVNQEKPNATSRII